MTSHFIVRRKQYVVHSQVKCSDKKLASFLLGMLKTWKIVMIVTVLVQMFLGKECVFFANILWSQRTSQDYIYGSISKLFSFQISFANHLHILTIKRNLNDVQTCLKHLFCSLK
jgi:hypothetical protein